MEFYNPLYLPERIDFHKATKEFPISRQSKTRLQIALSKMTKGQVKNTIKALKRMEYECLEGRARITWEKMGKYIKDRNTRDKVFQEISPELKDDFKMAVWCKFCRDFAEKYLISLEKQKKI